MTGPARLSTLSPFPAVNRKRRALMTQPLSRLPRRTALLLPLLLAACGGGETRPPDFPPLTYGYLTKLRLAVGSIGIDDSWAPRGGERHVGYLSPTTPLAALRQMAEDRLVAAGGPNRALFTIDDASIVQTPTRYEGHLAVTLAITDPSGAGVAEARAEVSKSARRGEDTPEAVRAALYDLTKALMQDMNVEFEYQVRRALQQQIAPPPGVTQPVQSEDLTAPGKTP